jgi:hypothetical protein
MSHLTNRQNWSLIALVLCLMLNVAVGFAPANTHVLGNWSDPVSAMLGAALVACVVMEVGVLFSMSRRAR